MDLYGIVGEFMEHEAKEWPVRFARCAELAELVPAQGGLSRSAEALETFRALIRERKRAVSAMRSAEEALFARIAAGVEDGQAAADAIRQWRARQRWEAFPCDVPMADVDLRAIVTQLRQASQLQVLDAEGWTAALSAHDTELAGLHEQRVTRKLDAIVEDAVTRQQHPGDAEAILAARHQRMGRRLRAERAILAANARWEEALAAMLAPQSAQCLRRAVKAAAYPHLHPCAVELWPVQECLHAMAADHPAIKELAEQVDAECAAIHRAEKQAETTALDLAIDESISVTYPQRREALAAEIAQLNALRLAAARRVVAACEQAALVAREPAVVRLTAACAAQDAPPEAPGVPARAAPGS